MNNFLKGLLLAIILVTGNPTESTAQLAKIHRKYATFTIQPAFLTMGDTVSATIQPWTEIDAWNIVRSLMKKAKLSFPKKSIIPQTFNQSRYL